jgi:hypothetical protein
MPKKSFKSLVIVIPESFIKVYNDLPTRFHLSELTQATGLTPSTAYKVLRRCQDYGLVSLVEGTKLWLKKHPSFGAWWNAFYKHHIESILREEVVKV